MKQPRITKKKVLSYLLTAGVVVLFYIIFYTPTLKLPVKWASFWGGIEAEPSYIPFNYKESYMTNTSCGKGCDKVKFHYISTNTTLVVTATNDVSWNDDPKWNKKYKIKGTKYFYQEKNGKQYLDWEVTKEKLELEIEYKGVNKLAKSEVVKIANSIKADGNSY